MASNGGCASSDQEALSQEQVTSTIVGNTVYKDATEAYAFIDADGTIRAEISATDAIKTDEGKWSLDDTGSFCVEWTKTIHGKNNCAQFIAVDATTVQWGGHSFRIETGNSKNL